MIYEGTIVPEKTYWFRELASLLQRPVKGGPGDGTKVKVNSSTCQKLYFLGFFCCSVTLHEFHLWNLCFLISSSLLLLWFPLLFNQLREFQHLSQGPFPELINRRCLLPSDVEMRAWEAHTVICRLLTLAESQERWLPIDSKGTNLPVSQAHPGGDISSWCGVLLRYIIPLFGAVISSALGCCSVAKSCLTFCNPMDCSTPGFPVLHYLPEFAGFMSTESVMPSNHLILLAPFSSCPQPFPASGSFPMSWLFTSVGQSIGASAIVLPVSIQGWFLLRLTGLSPFCPRDSQESSPAPQFKSISSLVLSFLDGPALTYMTTGKTIALTRWTFVSKIMSLFFNMLSRFVIALRSKHLQAASNSSVTSAPKYLVKRWQWQRVACASINSSQKWEHRKEANPVLQLYLIAKGTQALHFRSSIKGALCLQAQPQWLGEGIWSVALIILFTLIMSLPDAPIISVSKWEKWSYVTLWVWAHKPNWQAPLISESSPLTKELGSPGVPHQSVAKLIAINTSQHFSFWPPPWR